jgi:glycosyltransferase involved in cell wall biosynthesis
MKILHLLGDRNLPRDPDDAAVGGVVRAPLELARAQVSLGHEVSIAIVGKETWQATWHGVQLVGLAMVPWARVRVNERRLDFRQHLPYVFFTRRHTFDIVHGHLYLYMRFLRAKRRVVHLHGDPLYKGSRNEGIDLKPADFARIVRYSDAQVAVSKFVANELELSLGGLGNVHVVSNCVETARFNPEHQKEAGLRLRRAWGVQNGEIVFLFAGAIVPEKGVIHLARAFTRLAVHTPRVHIVLAGTSGIWGGALEQHGVHADYEHEVRRALQVAIEAGRVHFLGKVPAAEMPGVYAASDVVILPSVCREGFGLVILEALASERPVIASSTGGLVETVNEQNGILVPPGDEAGLEAAMRTLAIDHDLRRRLGIAARQQARCFSWENAARQLDNIYRSIAARRVV